MVWKFRFDIYSCFQCVDVTSFVLFDIFFLPLNHFPSPFLVWDTLSLGTYILPGGLATSRAIAPFEAEAIEAHPYIKEAFGDNYQWEVSMYARCFLMTCVYCWLFALLGDCVQRAYVQL